MTTETPPPAEPPWVKQLKAQLGPDPSLAEVALRILCAGFGRVRDRAGFARLPRESVDLAAQLLQELKFAEIVDPDTGEQLADLQICNQGLYWATIVVPGCTATTLTERTREALEQRVRALVAKERPPRPSPVIRDGGGG